MARPREFDTDAALDGAIRVFREHGFEGTSAQMLVDAMGIGRQSLYNAFGDKRQLYLEALRTYQQRSTGVHLARLRKPTSPIEGIRDMLVGLAPEDNATRLLGCMGVGSICEFGATDAELAELRLKVAPVLYENLLSRIREGQAMGEIDRSIDAREAAASIQTMMLGLQVAARGGASASELHTIVSFSVGRLRPK